MLVRLDHETDLAGFRAQARQLLARGVAPQDVSWSAGRWHDDLFADSPAGEAPAPAADAAVHVPAGYLALCRAVILHREPRRLALLYRLLWRLVHEPALRHDPLDADMLQARQMARAVQRDIHKMRAFVRFRQVPDDDGARGPLHVAWFEPEHRIVEASAPWFQRRFANMRWAILTPDRCAEWDLRELRLRGGARREEAPPPDAGEALWLTYYRSIFNPARLNLPLLRKEMPRRYWQNLPEAQLIAPLAAAAQERSARMIAQPPTHPLRRLPRPPPQAAMLPEADALAALRQRMQQCRACPLGAAATQAVCGEGPLRPARMFVGEQPGDQEDLRGRPFVGPAGQLFERALQALGVARDSVYISNAVRHFKYELRGARRIHKTPAQQEVTACAHWLEEEIALVRPQALVALGGTAARTLLARPVAVLAERGAWFTREDGLPVLVTLHPSALLRLPPARQPQAFEDFVRDLRRAFSPTPA
jgi:probable DNA metabolism protein